MSVKFTDPIVFQPKPKPPANSWWAMPEVQSDREKFSAWALAERERIVGSRTFGGNKPTHDKFQRSK